jgi:hypothetical protein
LSEARICRLEFVWAQQGRDHVAGDHQSADGVDELNDHGSDPPQRERVEHVEEENGDAAAYVEQVKHEVSRSKVGATAPIGSIGFGRIKKRPETMAVAVRDS